jgi:hypothetical protein
MHFNSRPVTSLSDSIGRLSWAFLIVVLVSVGCSDQPRPYPVSGKVLFDDGAPLSGGRIEVRSLEHPLVARASIGRDGEFTLTTFKANDGAVAGDHEVLIVQKFTADIDNMAEHAKHASLTRTLDKKFSKYKTSGLTINVERGGAADITLSVTSE